MNGDIFDRAEPVEQRPEILIGLDVVPDIDSSRHLLKGFDGSSGSKQAASALILMFPTIGSPIDARPILVSVARPPKTN